MSDYDAIRNLHNGLTKIPTDGTVALYAPQPFAKRDVLREKEFLVNHKVIDCVRHGKEYLYTLDTGQKYSSFYKPHAIQWTPGP